MGLDELVSSVQVSRQTAGPTPPCLRLSFDPPLESVPSWLTEVFDGYAPAYAYGVCRVVDMDEQRWTVTATLGSPSREPAAFVVPNPERVVCTVTPSGMDIVIFENVSVERAVRFVRAVRKKEGATIDRSRARHRRYQRRT